MNKRNLTIYIWGHCKAGKTENDNRSKGNLEKNLTDRKCIEMAFNVTIAITDPQQNLILNFATVLTMKESSTCESAGGRRERSPSGKAYRLWRWSTLCRWLMSGAWYLSYLSSPDIDSGL